MFQRRHMQEIAEVLKDLSASDNTIGAFAVMLSCHNPNFNFDRFVEACKEDDSG